MRQELVDTGARLHRLYVLEIAGPNPRIKIGRSKNPWGRIPQHLREMNRYQYGLVDLHLTDSVPAHAIERAETQAHRFMTKFGTPIAQEEFTNSDFASAVTCADIAAMLAASDSD
ncbi:hypothetical protein [Streptomyces sp. NPDC008125]|uniref:hypothetical protein n=1 Tax=Streptomyces sp. NPDC008125 TaxID=3364811 RepID=UPI0036F017AA